MRVEIPVFDGFDEIDAFGPFEALSTTGFDVALVTVGHPRLIESARGLRLDVQEELGSPDGIVVPGGGWNSHAPKGARAEAQRGELPEALRARAGDTQWIASVCTGAMVVAAAGLLEGRYATTNRSAFEDLRPHVRDVVAERVVDHGDRITAGGLTAGLDLGMWIIERELGTAAADRRCEDMEYQRQGRVWIAPRS